MSALDRARAATELRTSGESFSRDAELLATLALAEEARLANLLTALRDQIITGERAQTARRHIIASFNLLDLDDALGLTRPAGP